MVIGRVQILALPTSFVTSRTLSQSLSFLSWSMGILGSTLQNWMQELGVVPGKGLLSSGCAHLFSVIFVVDFTSLASHWVDMRVEARPFSLVPKTQPFFPTSRDTQGCLAGGGEAKW